MHGDIRGSTQAANLPRLCVYPCLDFWTRGSLKRSTDPSMPSVSRQRVWHRYGLQLTSTHTRSQGIEDDINPRTFVYSGTGSRAGRSGYAEHEPSPLKNKPRDEKITRSTVIEGDSILSEDHSWPIWRRLRQHPTTERSLDTARPRSATTASHSRHTLSTTAGVSER